MIQTGTGVANAGHLKLISGLSQREGAVLSLEGSHSIFGNGGNLTVIAGSEGEAKGGTISISSGRGINCQKLR